MASIERCIRVPAYSGLRAHLAIAAVTAAVIAMGACNTTEGLGKDVKSVGGGIEDRISNRD
jgi:predicted small secreted protein